MPDLTIPQAAAQLGVSVDTVKRRCRRGALRCRRTAEGRVMVELAVSPNGTAAPQPRGSAPQVQGTPLHDERALRGQLAAMTAERDWLRARLEVAEVERHELRVLLGAAQQQLAAALPAAQDAPQSVVRTTDSAEARLRDETEPSAPWYRRLWQGIGL